MVAGTPEGGRAADAIAKVRECYSNGITDEFVVPFTCVDGVGKPVGLLRDEDVIINFNYRADRVRQITRVLTRRSGLTADPMGEPGASYFPPPPPSTRRFRSICFLRVCTTFA